ncbi:MAG: aminotransferase class V-fold PLP-dependent enzyme [Parcubacteria group bacterium]
MNWFQKKIIFLDYASATPVLTEVREVMDKYWSRDFYNPSAIYEEGVRVKKEVDEFKSKVAELMGAAKEGVLFTSGGTESNVLAVLGLKNTHVIIDTESHPSVSEAAKGLNVSTWRLGQELEIGKTTTLISTVTTDNKIGRKVRQWRRLDETKRPLLHVDASQTANYFKIGLEALACDLITLDGAKLYGPKGIGALVVRKGVVLDLPPRGTLPVPLIGGFVKALEIASRDRESEAKRLTVLSQKFAEMLRHSLPSIGVSVTVPNIVNVSVPAMLPEFLVLSLERHGVLSSAGPACNSNKPEPPETPVRFSFGRFSTLSDVRRAAETFYRVCRL